MEHTNTDLVPESSEYRCTACGGAQEFEVGDDFTLCDACGDENAGWERVVSSEAVEEGLGEEESA